MNKKLLKKIVAVFAVMAMLLMNVSLVSAADKVNGFPLPTNKSYAVTVLSRYSGGSSHDIYLYQYGPLKGQNTDTNVIMDISAAANTPIYAVGSGTIRTNKYGSGGGNYLVIAHGDGTYSYYGHMMNQSPYGVGSYVNAGDIIGYVGKTGTATGYHLHFEWSGHDPYCEFSSKGYVYTCPNSGASVYPHTHSSSGSSKGNSNNDSANAYTAYVVNTDGSLAINSTNSAGHQIGTIPEGAACTVYPNKSVGNWRWVTYNGVSGYSYSKYLTTTNPKPQPNNNSGGSSSTYTAYVFNTDGNLVINSKPAKGNQIGLIPEGASCTVDPNRKSGNWCWVTYNGVSGYSYSKYLTTSKPNTPSQPVNQGGSSSNTWTGVIRGTDGNLVINSKPAKGNQIGLIPEGASCTVYPDRTSGNWYWVEYNGVSGYSYKSYIVQSGSYGGTSNTRTGVIHGTDGNLAINSIPKAGNQVGLIPEGASCTVYPDKTSGNWYWVEYNGVSGYSYKAYIALQ